MSKLPSNTQLNQIRVAVPYSVDITNFQQAMQFAEIVSASNFAPKEMRGKANDCLLAMQFGAEIGLKPIQALQNVAVINGKPSLWGDAALAVVRSSPDFESIQEWIEGDGDNMLALCDIKRQNEPAQRRTFSVKDAKNAGLWGKNVWKSYPSRMLQMRARSFALRDVFPDALKGLILTEEAQDYPEPVNITPTEPAPTQAPEISRERPQTLTTHQCLAVEAEIQKAGLWEQRERIKRWISTKFEVDEWRELNTEQADELAQCLPRFAETIQQEQKTQFHAQLDELTRFMDENSIKWEEAFQETYGTSHINHLDLKQLKGAIKYCKKMLQVYGLKMDGLHDDYSEKCRLEAQNLRKNAQYAENRTQRENDLNRAKELEEEAAAREYEIGARLENHDVQIL